jgi:hypothetical protein
MQAGARLRSLCTEIGFNATNNACYGVERLGECAVELVATGWTDMPPHRGVTGRAKQPSGRRSMVTGRNVPGYDFLFWRHHAKVYRRPPAGHPSAVRSPSEVMNRMRYLSNPLPGAARGKPEFPAR